MLTTSFSRQLDEWITREQRENPTCSCCGILESVSVGLCAECAATDEDLMCVKCGDGEEQ
jgi:hypothetical protein